MAQVVRAQVEHRVDVLDERGGGARSRAGQDLTARDEQLVAGFELGREIVLELQHAASLPRGEGGMHEKLQRGD